MARLPSPLEPAPFDNLRIQALTLWGFLTAGLYGYRGMTEDQTENELATRVYAGILWQHDLTKTDRTLNPKP